MANPFQHDSSGFNPDVSLTSFLPRYRNSPYPSTIAGSGAPLTPASHSPLNRLSYLLNPSYESSSDLYAANRAQTQNADMDMSGSGSGADGVASGSQSHTPQLPLYSRTFERWLDNDVTVLLRKNVYRKNGFFTPSYLSGSNYIQKLEEAHKAKLAQKETQQSPGITLPAGIATTASLSNKPPASHLGVMTYDLIERTPAIEDDSPIAPLPSRWNNDDKHGALEVIGAGQEVKYAASRSSRESDHESCAIRADHPMPWQAGIYYFEVTLLSRRRDEYVQKVNLVLLYFI